MTRSTLTSVRCSPGNGSAVVGDRGVALVDAGPDHRLVVAIAEVFGAGGGFDEVLDALATHGFRDLPSFAVVAGQERGLRAISRGSVRIGVTAKTPIDPSALSGTTMVTWREIAVPAARSWEVFTDEHDDRTPAEPGSFIAPSGAVIGASHLSGQVEDVADDGLDDGAFARADDLETEPATSMGPPPEDPVDVAAQFVAGPSVFDHEALDGTIDDPADAPGDLPEVDQLICDAGHANPPEAERCRQCAGPISDRAIYRLPRPDLGRLVFDSGRSCPLTAPVVIGRNPPTDAEVDGERATPFRLPDPDAVLSRHHLDISLNGWDVLVIDKRSRNSTTITRPGEAPRRLLPAVPTEIPLGTRVVLADAVTFIYEPPR